MRAVQAPLTPPQHPPSVLADLAAMLLSNLTAHDSVCARILDMHVAVVPDAALSGGYYPAHSRAATSPPPPPPCAQGDTVDVPALPLLVDAFAASGSGSARRGQLHFLASVFANLSAVRPLALRAPFRADSGWADAARAFVLRDTPPDRCAVSGRSHGVPDIEIDFVHRVSGHDPPGRGRVGYQVCRLSSAAESI